MNPSIKTNVLAIEANNVCKFYPKIESKLLCLWNVLIGNSSQKGFLALKDISFKAKTGDIIGIIGKNGAGKSTLLQILSGTLKQSSGEVFVNGSIGAILELGAGFNADFTGKENALLYAKTLGIKDSYKKDILEKILDFSELGEFFDQPIRTYSSGMIVRLAFAVATHFDSDILIVDEALSVGDSSFQLKSFEMMKKLLSEGKTMFFCSHSMYHIQAICNKAIYLSEGEIKSMGNTQKVIKSYEDDIYFRNPESFNPNTEKIFNETIGKFCSFNFHVNSTLVKKECILVNSGKDEISIDISCLLESSQKKYSIGLAFFDSNKMPVCSSATHFQEVQIEIVNRGSLNCKVTFHEFPLLKGKYTIDFFLMCGDGMVIFDHAKDVFQIEVLQHSNEVGLFSIPSSWNIEN